MRREWWLPDALAKISTSDRISFDSEVWRVRNIPPAKLIALSGVGALAKFWRSGYPIR